MAENKSRCGNCVHASIEMEHPHRSDQPPGHVVRCHLTPGSSATVLAMSDWCSSHTAPNNDVLGHRLADMYNELADILRDVVKERWALERTVKQAEKIAVTSAAREQAEATDA